MVRVGYSGDCDVESFVEFIADGYDGPHASDATAQHADPRRILNSIGEVVYDWDIASDRLRWGPNALEVLGLEPGFTIDTGGAWAELLVAKGSGCRRDRVIESGERDTGAGVRYQMHYAIRSAAAEGSPVVWLDDTGRWFAGPDGRPAHAHGAVRVIANLQSDPLSRAPRSIAMAARAQVTQEMLRERLGQLLSPERAPGETFALLLIDVDGGPAFERLSQTEIDAALEELVRRIGARMRASDSICRYGERRLALLLEACAGQELPIAFARFVKAAQAEALPGPAAAAQVELIGGGAIATGGGGNVDDLVRSAEQALKTAAARPGRGLAIQSDDRAGRSDRANANALVCAEIRAALAERRIAVALQPIVSSQTRTPAIWEALVRLRRSDGQLLQPASILPAAEESGLIAEIDHRVLELALDLLEAEPARVLSINVSGATLHHPAWLERVERALAGRGRCAQRLIFEITETCAIRDLNATGRIIEHLHGLGGRIAMDDFGAGHTSFRNLRALHIDMLKIDGAFVQNIMASADDQFFVRTLHDLARHLNILTVAEWVETEQAADLLASWGVDYLQGACYGLAVEHKPGRALDAA